MAAQKGLEPDESVGESDVYVARGLEQSIVEVVVAGKSRAFVVDEDGNVQSTQQFWRRERDALLARFGRMSPELFAQQQGLSTSDVLGVDIIVRVDAPLPMLPFDGTDKYVPVEQYEQWFAGNAQSVTSQIRAAKQPMLALLASQGADIVADYRALPIIRARVPVSLLRAQELNGDNVTRIDIVHPDSFRLLADHAGHASMNALTLSGGVCGGECTGGSIDVGIWERDSGGADQPPFPTAMRPA